MTFYLQQCEEFYYWTLWRNGSASDSRSEGCVFKSRQGHVIYFYNDFSKRHQTCTLLSMKNICKSFTKKL